MPRRTVAAARRELEALAPGLNPVVYARLSTVINAAAAKARTVGDRMLDRIFNEMQVQRDEVLADVCTLRDDFQALIAEGELGTLSATEYHDRLRSLQSRQRTLVRRERELVGMANRAEQIEADPEAYGDSLFAKFPDTQPDFTF